MWTKSDYQALIDTVTDHHLLSGLFDRVNQHESKKAPGNGLTADIYLEDLLPYPPGSGMQKTSGIVIVASRIMFDMLIEPLDNLDPMMFEAANDLIGRIHGDFTLGGLVRNVDLLGASGQALRAESGHINIDSKMLRAVEVHIPCIVNDLWDQVA